MTQQTTPEFVLVIPRTELEAQGIDFSGIQKIDLEKFNPENFGFLPRALIDNKSDTSIAPSSSLHYPITSALFSIPFYPLFSPGVLPLYQTYTAIVNRYVSYSIVKKTN